MIPVTQPADARPVHRPGTQAGAKAFIITPFARMARTHAGSTMADAMVAASLAGSLFFTLPAGDARGPVLRYLVITMLPFAVVSPLIGPMIDRMKGGHRLMVVGSLVLRALLCYLMATVINGGSLLFFFYALCLLVCQKAYQVGRSALVPTVVQSADELVEANSKLSLISGLAGFVGVLPAAILLKVFGPEWSLRLGMLVYAVAAVLALQITRVRVAEESADETERHELRGASIVMAGSAMGLIRACVGFLTLLVAFDFRGGERPAWQFGVVGGASVISQLAGAAAGPRIRSITSEENLLTSVLALLVAGSVLALVLGDVTGAAVLGACVGFAAGGGKLAFDSILQRDAPDANRGRAFAKFETRFQVTWVIGALIPVAITMGVEVGFAVVLALSVIALTSYLVARLAYAHRMGHHQSAATAAAVEIEDRFAEVSGEVKGRLASGSRAALRRLRTGRTAAVDGSHDLHRPHGPHGAGPPDLQPGDDSEHWPEPQWADGPTQRAGEPVTEIDPDRPRRRGRRRRNGDEPVPAPDRPYDDLAAESPTAWSPPDDDAEFPWQPPPDTPDPVPGYLADVDPAVENPFPWTPDDARRGP
ncbi:MAG: putative major facilitator superfamily transporter [Acidimicrobiales bacterium]|nr:putative major facilitator superfamily transporter [Acidimicrobiales bacterium]